MPKGKKRRKPRNQEREIKSNNPVKTWWGKTIVITLAVAFVLSIIISLIYNMFQLFG